MKPLTPALEQAASHVGTLIGALVSLTFLLALIALGGWVLYAQAAQDRDTTCQAAWLLTTTNEQEVLFTRAAPWCPEAR